MKKIFVPVMIMAAVMFSSCGGNTETGEEKPKNQLQALKELGEKAQTMAKDLENREVVDPVDFRKLKELLPEDAAGLPLKESSGEKNGAMGFTISTAEARYASEDGQSSMDITLTDAAGISGFAMMGLAAWSLAEVDKETSNGYEKTLSIDGHKAFEKYDNANKSGEISVIVGERFIVKVEGDQVDMAQIKKALKDIDLDALAKVN